jgi:hypothetical protein
MSKRRHNYQDTESRRASTPREDVVPDSPYLDPEGLTVSADGGGSFTFNVVTLDNPTQWEVLAQEVWVTIVSPTDPVTGDAAVVFAADVNDGEARSATIAIVGLDLDFQVDQEGAAGPDPQPPGPQQPPETPEEQAKRKSPIDWTSQ